jgi:hypothetical protein
MTPVAPRNPYNDERPASRTGRAPASFIETSLDDSNGRLRDQAVVTSLHVLNNV